MSTFFGLRSDEEYTADFSFASLMSYGAFERVTRDPISLTLILPLRDSGLPVVPSDGRLTNLRSTDKTLFDISSLEKNAG